MQAKQMKKLLIVCLLGFQFAQSQNTTSVFQGDNEVRLDVLSLITSSKIQVSYERFLNSSFSVGVSGAVYVSQSDKDDFNQGFDRTLPETEITPFVRYTLPSSATRFYFVEVFTAYNSGKFRELQRFVDDSNNGYYTSRENNYNDVALGGAIGYKMYFKEKISLDLHVGIGKNLFQQGNSPDLISRVGANIGYRF
jgi:hypothetical protein